MFGNVVRSLCRDRRGLSFVASAIGVLSGVERLLSATAKPVSVAPIARSEPTKTRVPAQPRLKISRTKSDLGYVYWVLREYGESPTYALFDTWREAMDEAIRRINAKSETRSSAVLVFA